MARFNSLLSRNKFPVPMRRELAHNAFFDALFWLLLTRWGPRIDEIPCKLPASREFGVQRRVRSRLPPPAASQERTGPPRCGDAGQYTNWIGTAGISVA